MDIYRVMRPGEPPTVEAASALFDSLFFDVNIAEGSVEMVNNQIVILAEIN